MLKRILRTGSRATYAIGTVLLVFAALAACHLRTPSVPMPEVEPSSRPQDSLLPDSTLARLRAHLPAGVSPVDSASLVIGVIAGGRTNTPLQFAYVILQPAGEQPPIGARADSTGRFVVGPVAPGRYRFTARRLGYVPVTSELDLRAGIVDTLCVNLPEQYIAIHWDCIGPDGGFGSQYCPAFTPDSATLGRPHLRCS